MDGRAITRSDPDTTSVPITDNAEVESFILDKPRGEEFSLVGTQSQPGVRI
jgi:hypothetical protein